MADRLGVDVRTVRRDIEKLRNLGYPVDAAAGQSGYRLGAGAVMPPLLLDDDETIAVALGLYLATGGPISGTEESALRALAKIEQVIPNRLRHRFAALRDAAAVVPSGAVPVSAETINTITKAIHDNRQLRFDFSTIDGTLWHCTTEPHKLLSVGRRWYLLAWELEGDYWHTYRVDLLAPRSPLGPRFTPRQTPNDDVTQLISRDDSAIPHKIRVPITLAASITEAVERIPPTIGHFEAIDENTCLLLVGANSYDELAVRLGLAGFPFRIHGFCFKLEESSELVAFLRDLIAPTTGATNPKPAPEIIRAADREPDESAGRTSLRAARTVEARI